MHIHDIQIRHERFPVRDTYPFSLELLQHTDRLPLTTPVTFFVGENGTGKSTLLQAVCRRCHVHIWEGMDVGRANYNPHERKLHRALDVTWNSDPVPGSYFGSDTFHHFARVLDQWAAADPGQLDYFGGRSLLELSHGQSLLAFFRNRYHVEGLYFMDEPETALSPASQVALVRLLTEVGQRGHAQFLIATHSPILLACPGATIYSFDHTPVRAIAYEDVRHVQLYRDFLNDPEQFLEPRERDGP